MEPFSAESRELYGSCTGCPGIADCLRTIKEAKEGRKRILGDYIDRVHEVEAAEQERKLRQNPNVDDASIDQDRILAEIIQYHGYELEEYERESTYALQAISDLQLGCAGVIRVATIRRGLKYTITACSSPQLLKNGRYENDAVIIEEDPA